MVQWKVIKVRILSSVLSICKKTLQTEIVSKRKGIKWRKGIKRKSIFQCLALWKVEIYKLLKFQKNNRTRQYKILQGNQRLLQKVQDILMFIQRIQSLTLICLGQLHILIIAATLPVLIRKRMSLRSSKLKETHKNLRIFSNF